METTTRPEKMARLPKGTVTRRRAIRGRGQPPSAAGKPLAVLYVSHKAPFMSLVTRATKALDAGPGGAKWSATKVLPLPERVAAHEAATQSQADRALRQRTVQLLATGHAIGKLVQVAAYFQRQPGYVVAVRTQWASTVDDVLADDATDAAGAEDEIKDARLHTRGRNVSCLAVDVRLA